MSKNAARIGFMAVSLLLVGSCTADLLFPDACSLTYEEGEIRDQVKCGWKIPQPSEWDDLE